MKVILTNQDNYRELTDYLKKIGCHKILLVCGKSIDKLRLGEYFETLPSSLEITIVKFSGFTPNPTYEEVVEGVEIFNHEKCDAIVAVGGGSAIDVAKCIKLYSTMDATVNYLNQDIRANDIPLIAIPTTAGTGSEATRFAVIYYKGLKQSVSHESCIPSAVLFDPTCLGTLPDYQKKATLLDALCHATESYWSVGSTETSMKYADEAIKIIIKNMDAYLANDTDASSEMLRAAHLAGKAINISQTTAGHAMSYKLTSLYGISHGHAVALCVSQLLPFMVEGAQIGMCRDDRGVEHLRSVFDKLADAYGFSGSHTDDWDVKARWLCETFSRLVYDRCKMEIPIAKREDYNILQMSVNPDRLANNPISIDAEQIDYLYRKILRG